MKFDTYNLKLALEKKFVGLKFDITVKDQKCHLIVLDTETGEKNHGNFQFSESMIREIVTRHGLSEDEVLLEIISGYTEAEYSG